MNRLDLVLLLVLVSAIVTGRRMGIVARIASWIGVAAGIVLGARIAPELVALAPNTSAQSRLAVGVAGFTVPLAICASVADAIGSRIRRTTERSIVGSLDGILGGIGGVVSVLIPIWLLTPAAANVPVAAGLVRGSAIATSVASALPPPPSFLEQLRSVVSDDRFPEVFDNFRPAPEVGPPPADLVHDRETLQRITAATANLEVTGCGAGFEGSAWAIEDDLLVTNAHVVAGATALTARHVDGRTLDGEVIAYDKDNDLALVRVPGFDAEPLRLTDPAEQARATVVGYPRGQNQPRATTAKVEGIRLVTGRDVEGRERVERRLLFLASVLQPGDSGSPVVGADGRVIGVVFAIAPDQPGLAYAVHPAQVRALRAAPRTGPGPCLG